MAFELRKIEFGQVERLVERLDQLLEVEPEGVKRVVLDGPPLRLEVQVAEPAERHDRGRRLATGVGDLAVGQQEQPEVGVVGDLEPPAGQEPEPSLEPGEAALGLDPVGGAQRDPVKFALVTESNPESLLAFFEESHRLILQSNPCARPAALPN